VEDPLDVEFDRFDGGAHADSAAAAGGGYYKTREPLGRPVDLDLELDM